MTINISGQVPPKEQNGMYALEEKWGEIPDPEVVYAVVAIDRDGVTLKKDGTRKSVMRFVSIFPVADEREAQVKAWIQEERGLRQGTPLDMPAEPEIDLETPLHEKPTGEEPASLDAKRAAKDKS